MTESPFVVEKTFRVRYAETDAQGVVHHSSYIIYLEEGRLEYMRQRGGSYNDFVQSGFYLPVTEIQARYIKSSEFDDSLRIRCWVAQVRSRTLTFQYEIINEKSGQSVFTGSSKHVCLTHDGQIARMPQEWLGWG